MITPEYTRAMAAYNRWQNRSLYREADALTDAERKQPCGAFFGSIHGTLSHLLFGDQIWMHRFAARRRQKPNRSLKASTPFPTGPTSSSSASPSTRSSSAGLNGWTHTGWPAT